MQPSMPARLIRVHQAISIDTPENRFVKHAVVEMEAFLAAMQQRLGDASGTDRRLQIEIKRLRESLARQLSHAFFRDIGQATILPLGSPVLQRRIGYREILRVWLKFALLYEYWVFFQLLDVVSNTFDLDAPPVSELVQLAHDRLDVRLRSGTQLMFTGRTRGASQIFSIRFAYNRTFTGAPRNLPSYPRRGSWTRTMRPDYSLSFWPVELSEIDAEQTEQIIHVHFDAKYRVDSVTDLFGSEDVGDLEDEEAADRLNTRPKRSDLLKMHAYRDAIRRTEGAYVIYPGRSQREMWYGFHEILPGLGAFGLRPDNVQFGVSAIQGFLNDVVKQITDSDSRLAEMRRQMARVQRRS
jgi:predicted component of viral defense system (DUF524 family)